MEESKQCVRCVFFCIVFSKCYPLEAHLNKLIWTKKRISNTTHCIVMIQMSKITFVSNLFLYIFYSIIKKWATQKDILLLFCILILVQLIFFPWNMFKICYFCIPMSNMELHSRSSRRKSFACFFCFNFNLKRKLFKNMFKCSKRRSTVRFGASHLTDF